MISAFSYKYKDIKLNYTSIN